MYNDGKVQICVGTCSSVLSWIAGLSFQYDIMPVVSYIGVIAGTFIGLHGAGVIIYTWIKKLRS